MNIPNPGSLTVTLASLSAATIFQAALPAVPEPLGWLAQIKDLGLTTAVIIALIVVWKKYQDCQAARTQDQAALVAALTLNAETSRTFTEAIREVIKSNQEMKASNQELAEAVDRMTTAREAIADVKRPHR